MIKTEGFNDESGDFISSKTNPKRRVGSKDNAKRLSRESISKKILQINTTDDELNIEETKNTSPLMSPRKNVKFDDAGNKIETSRKSMVRKKSESEMTPAFQLSKSRRALVDEVSNIMAINTEKDSEKSIFSFPNTPTNTKINNDNNNNNGDNNLIQAFAISSQTDINQDGNEEGTIKMNAIWSYVETKFGMDEKHVLPLYRALEPYVVENSAEEIADEKASESRTSFDTSRRSMEMSRKSIELSSFTSKNLPINATAALGQVGNASKAFQGFSNNIKNSGIMTKINKEISKTKEVVGNTLDTVGIPTESLPGMTFSADDIISLSGAKNIEAGMNQGIKQIVNDLKQLEEAAKNLAKAQEKEKDDLRKEKEALTAALAAKYVTMSYHKLRLICDRLMDPVEMGDNKKEFKIKSIHGGVDLKEKDDREKSIYFNRRFDNDKGFIHQFKKRFADKKKKMDSLKKKLMGDKKE